MVGPDPLERRIRAEFCRWSPQWLGSALVREEWLGQVVWSGEVHFFGLDGHPQAKEVYAWEHETDDGGRRVVTVLKVPPVDSAAAAVRAAIAADYRGRKSGPGEK